MKWIRTFLMVLLVYSPELLPAQYSEQYREESPMPETAVFGEITDSLFALEPLPDYPYEYLLRQIRVGFRESDGRIRALLEYHYRIRIDTDDPVEQAEAGLITIPYHYADGIERIEEVEAVTYHPEGRRYFLDPESKQTAELNSRYNTLEFLLPKLREGAILEVRYLMSRSYIEELPDVYLAQPVPTRRFHLMLHNEPFLRYRVVEPEPRFSLDYHEELIDTSRAPRVFTIQRPDPISVEHWYGSIPAVDDPVYSPPINDLRGVLRLQISEFGMPRQPLENSWEFVAAQIRRGELNPYRRLEELEEVRLLGAELTENVQDERERLERLYRHLNLQMTHNDELQPFPVTPLSDVLDGEPSDQAAVNLVMMALLDGAGIKVKPVLLSGREQGEIDRDFPSLHQFDQLLLLAEIGDSKVWLDGSYSHARPGLIRTESFHNEGLLLGPDSHEWVQVEPSESRFDMHVRLDGELNSRGDLEADVEITSDGYPAREMWQMMAGQATAAELFHELFFDSYESIRFREATVEERGEFGYPLQLKGQFELPGYALSFSEGLQFHPMILGYMDENPLPDEDREVPLLLDAPESLSMEYRLQLPEGFRLEERRHGGRTGREGALLTERYEVSGREVAYRFEVDISRREFQPDEYEHLREFYERWVYLSRDEWFISMEE